MSVWERLKLRRTERRLLLSAFVVLALMLANIQLALGLPFGQETAVLFGGFAGVFLLAHLVLCWLAPYSDNIMLPVAAGLNALGTVMIYRLDLAKETSLAGRQLLWTVVSVVLALIVLAVIRNYQQLRRYSYLCGIGGVLLLMLPMVWPSKPDLGLDAALWISIGPFTLQPGEFAKPLLLIFFASLLSTKRALITTAGKKFLGLELPRMRDLAPIVAFWGIAIVIMVGENDFGPALLLFGSVLGMIYIATSRASWLIIGGFLVALGGTGAYQVSSKIQARFSNFLDPLAHYETTGYQPSQALFGMSYGGITGTGLAHGHPELVPVVESDYILAAMGEELGLVGLSAIILLFAIFISRGFRTALLTRDSFGKLLVSGLSLVLMIQVFVVVGGISSLLPMTGLTTPFMSQGGSALLANYFILALILRVSDSANRPAEATATPAAAPAIAVAAAPAAPNPAAPAQQNAAEPALKHAAEHETQKEGS